MLCYAIAVCPSNVCLSQAGASKTIVTMVHGQNYSSSARAKRTLFSAKSVRTFRNERAEKLWATRLNMSSCKQHRTVDILVYWYQRPMKFQWVRSSIVLKQTWGEKRLRYKIDAMFLRKVIGSRIRVLSSGDITDDQITHVFNCWIFLRIFGTKEVGHFEFCTQIDRCKY